VLKKIYYNNSFYYISYKHKGNIIFTLDFTEIGKIIDDALGNQFCQIDGDYMSSCHYHQLINQPNEFYYKNGLAINQLMVTESISNKNFISIWDQTNFTIGC